MTSAQLTVAERERLNLLVLKEAIADAKAQRRREVLGLGKAATDAA